MNAKTFLMLIPDCDYCGYKAMHYAKLKNGKIMCVDCVEKGLLDEKEEVEGFVSNRVFI